MFVQHHGNLRTAGAIVADTAVTASVSVTDIPIKRTLGIAVFPCIGFGTRKLFDAEIKIGIKQLGMSCLLQREAGKLHIVVEVMIPRHKVVIEVPQPVAEMRRIFALHLGIGVIEIQIP